MTQWRTARLGDIVELQRGFDITKRQQRPGEVPVVSSAGVSSFHDTAKCNGPGVIVGRKGSLGTAFFIDTPFWPHDTTLWVRDFKGNDPAYCYLLLKTLPLKELDAGASNPTLNRNHAHLLPVRTPELAAQRRISAVLFAFDELIECSSRRIEILQETTRLIYREWFVYHRTASRCDDLGFQRWSWVPFAELGEFTNGFAFKPEHWQMEGRPIIKIKELKNGVTTSTPRYPGADIPAKYEVAAGDLLFSWSGDLDAYLWAGPDGWLNQHLFRVDEREGIPRSWLFLALRDRMGEFRLRSQGTTMKHIQRSALSQVTVERPPAEELVKFDERAAPVLQLAVELRLQLAAVARARDLLLPKLVAGQIDIDSLGVDDVFGWTELVAGAPN